jgi:hypothetical protein
VDLLRQRRGVRHHPRHALGPPFTEQWTASEGLPTAYAEWGAKAGLDGSEFIRKSHEWFESQNVVQATYWDHW